VPFGPELLGDRVLLRAAVPADVDARQRLGRHAEIQRMFGAANPSTGPLTRRAAQAWVANLGGDDDTIQWVVEAEGSFLGTARLYSINAGSARYAITFLDPARLGQGYGTEVTALVLDHAFGDLGLEKVTLAVLVFNERAIRCYERCGFREVGRVADAAVIDGQAFDDILMAVTAHEHTAGA
jgi:RimJ/RimL family protein N-acetyltransferase